MSTNVAAIRYGVISDCTVRGKDAGDALNRKAVGAYTNGRCAPVRIEAQPQ